MTEKHDANTPPDQYKNVYIKALRDGVPLPGHRRPRTGLIFKSGNVICTGDEQLVFATDIHYENKLKKDGDMMWRVVCVCPGCLQVFMIDSTHHAVLSHASGYKRF